MKSFIAIICTLVFNVLTISKSGDVLISCGKHSGRKMIDIELRTVFMSEKMNVYYGDLHGLADALMKQKKLPFAFELMVCAEIADELRWKSQFVAVGADFSLHTEIPEAVVANTTIQLRENSPESDLAEALIRSFMDGLN